MAAYIFFKITKIRQNIEPILAVGKEFVPEINAERTML
jgi:hypothetical protein